MKALLWRTLLVLCFFLVLFIAIEFYFQPSLFKDPSGWLHTRSATAALISIAVLTADIFLPIPSSVIMILNGKLFGLIPGMFISLTGGMLASMTGYYVGRYGTGKLLRLKEKDRQDASRLISKWGIAVIIFTRPIPLLSESISIMAGVSQVPARKMWLACLAGHLPGALIYAFAGAYSATIQNNVLSFLIVTGVATISWIVSRQFIKSTT